MLIGPVGNAASSGSPAILHKFSLSFGFDVWAKFFVIANSVRIVTNFSALQIRALGAGEGLPELIVADGDHDLSGTGIKGSNGAIEGWRLPMVSAR